MNSSNVLELNAGYQSPTAEPDPVNRARVVMAAQGDIAGFEELVRQYKSLVCSIALAIVRDWEASEEVAQEVFVASWKRLKDLRNPDSFLPWLRQVTRNRANDYLRRQARNRKRFSLFSFSSPETENIPVLVSTDVRARMVRAEEVEALRTALEDLPEETREIVILFYREDQSVRQVAQLLDISESTVRQRLSRARARLRNDIEAYFSSVVVKTVPQATFTAGVVAAISFAAPVSAVAAGVSAAGKAAPIVTAGVWGGALVGLTCGIAAVLGGMRQNLRKAWDEEERRGLRLAAAAQIAVMVGFIGIIVGWAYLIDSPLKDHPRAALSLVAAYWVGLNAVFFFWTRRVTRRRRDIQRTEEPEVWAAEQRQVMWGVVVSVSVLIVSLLGLGMALYLRNL